jgi:GMP synthase-like glutamine amidotransferase
MPVIQTPEILVRSPFSVLPKEYVAFHWHGDTFAIPPGAVRQCSSAACVNQGFLYKEKVIGFQYHIEATEQSVSGLVKNCANELVEAPYIHSAEKIMQDTAKYQKTANGLIEKMLEAWLA